MDDREQHALYRVARAARALKRALDRCPPAALEIVDLELELDVEHLVALADELAGVVGLDDDDDE